jgi:hypothetical protein
MPGRLQSRRAPDWAPSSVPGLVCKQVVDQATSRTGSQCGSQKSSARCIVATARVPTILTTTLQQPNHGVLQTCGRELRISTRSQFRSHSLGSATVHRRRRRHQAAGRAPVRERRRKPARRVGKRVDSTASPNVSHGYVVVTIARDQPPAMATVDAQQLPEAPRRAKPNEISGLG